MAASRVVLVAMPLMARSGVYRSTHDLVAEARRAGLPWTAVIALRPSAAGESVVTDGVRELTSSARGRKGIAEIRRILRQSPEVHEADVVITLISQSDVAMSRSEMRQGRSWVAWVRGAPWPSKGEQTLSRRLVLKAVESRALRSADAVWATTPVLARSFVSAREARIVPAGVPPVRPATWNRDGEGPLVWAGRVDADKRPELFLQIVREMRRGARIFGEGPLVSKLRSHNTPGVTWEGWADHSKLWDDASLFVGTSAREAFGRSAVEAAAAGLPIVIGSEYGAAPLLFTDPRLREICVISSGDPRVWAVAVSRLLKDTRLLNEVAAHVHSNATQLTISKSIVNVTAAIDEIFRGSDTEARA